MSIDNKMHFWMASIKVIAVIPGNEEENTPTMLRNVETNILLDTTAKRINADAIDRLRQIALMKCQEKYNLDPQTIADFLIQNIMYLGLMSPKEYMGNTQPTRIEAN